MLAKLRAVAAPCGLPSTDRHCPRMHRRILIATDLSEASEAALDAGVALAKRDGAALAACHVVPDLGRSNMLFPQANEAVTLALADLERRAQEALAARVEAHTGPAPTAGGSSTGEVKAELFVETGVDYERIVARADAWNADLVVVASRGRTGLPRALLGSVAERVVRHAGKPVLVARSGPAGGPIVVATDLSEKSVPVVRVAGEESQRSKKPLLVLYALEVMSHPFAHAAGLPFGMTWQTLDLETQKAVREAGEEALSAACDLAGVTCEHRVLEGHPAAAVVAEADARAASLIVVATHGRTGLSRMALGSVAERIVRHAACSVLVVPLATMSESA